MIPIGGNGFHLGSLVMHSRSNAAVSNCGFHFFPATFKASIIARCSFVISAYLSNVAAIMLSVQLRPLSSHALYTVLYRWMTLFTIECM